MDGLLKIYARIQSDIERQTDRVRIAAMPDADFDYCVRTALSVVERRSEDGKTWTRVYSGGTLAFDDIDFTTTCILVSAVVQRELRPFIDALNL